MTATVCYFRRNKATSPTEKGLAISEVDLIVDQEGKVVPFPVYDYRLVWHEGTLVITE